jgi:hypothetical protein
MSDKPFNKLCDVDKRIRMLFPTMMWDNDETICTIEFFGGFEFFNSRPYHNYENWSEGYRIKADKRFGNIAVTSEDLDDALAKFEAKIIKYKEENKEIK